MDMVLWNEDYALPAFGFVNSGASCYFNALIQSLISCTSFNEEVLRHGSSPNECMRILSSIVSMARSGRQVQAMNSVLCRAFINKARERADIVQINDGQQCANEGFHILLDIFDSIHAIQRLFQHSISKMIYCTDCKEWRSIMRETNLSYIIEPDFKNDVPEQYKVLLPQCTGNTLQHFI